MSELMAERDTLQNRNSLLEKVVQVRSASDTLVQPQVSQCLTCALCYVILCHCLQEILSHKLVACMDEQTPACICLLTLDHQTFYLSATINESNYITPSQEYLCALIDTACRCRVMGSLNHLRNHSQTM